MATTDEEIRELKERLDREEAERKRLLGELRERTQAEEAEQTTPEQRISRGLAEIERKVEESGATGHKQEREARLRAQKGGDDG